MPFPIIPAIAAGTAAVGGLMNALGHKHPSKVKQTALYSPQQTALQNTLAQRGLNALDFEPIEQRLINQFHTQIIPSISQRFTSMGGTSGGHRSSGFEAALGAAGSDLASQLASLRYQFGLPMLQMGLQRQFENLYQPSTPSTMQQIGAGLLGGGMKMMPSLIDSWSRENTMNKLDMMQDKYGNYSKQIEDLKNENEQLRQSLGGLSGNVPMGSAPYGNMFSTPAYTTPSNSPYGYNAALNHVLGLGGF